MVSNFKTRTITSFILFTIFILFYILQLNHLFLIVIFAIVYYELFDNKIVNTYFLIISLLSYFFFLNYIDFTYNFIIDNSIFIFIFFICLLLITFAKMNIFVSKIMFNLFILICFFLFTLLYIHNFNIFFIVILFTSINDVLAYIIGSYFKGPKVIPSISPNKTWSGTLSSYLLSVALLFYFFDFAIIYNITLPITFFIGDIYFSRIKRILNIKDYGYLIKGHGGFLDRFDSSFLSLSFSFLMLLFI